MRQTSGKSRRPERTSAANRSMSARSSLWLLLAFLVVGMDQEASAQSSFEKMAAQSSAAAVSKSWSSIGKDCQKGDQLVQRIGSVVSSAAGEIRSKKIPRKEAADFGNGYIKGIAAALKQVAAQCPNDCNMIGQIGKASGEWSAEIFCAVSEAIEGPAKFDGLVHDSSASCSGSYARKCESSFVLLTRKTCSKYVIANDVGSYYRADRGGCCSFCIGD